jgi:hypothetical protein
MICKDLAPLYEKHMNKLKSELAKLDIEALETSVEEGNFGVIEDIFLNEIPSSFRHIVKIKSCWKTVDKTQYLEKFVAKPLKAYGEMNTLEFTEFLNYLTRNFKRMTAGCLQKQDRYLTWSNTFQDKSVSTWILPTEEEWKNAVLPECWDKFLTPKCSPRLMQRVYYYLGAIQDASNTAQQALVISDNGQTGKGTLVRILKRILPKKSFGFIPNSSLQDSDQFGLSNCNVQDNHIICISEYDGNSLCTNKGKAAIGGDTLTLNVKNRQSIQWDTYGTKFLITSNEGCVLKEHSYRRRIIPVTFKQTHKMQDNFTPAQIDELVNNGKAFLTYCYKVYKTCPLGTSAGEYLVMCPDHEAEFIKNGSLNLNDEQRLIKAFANDQEIQEYFYVGDYSDTEESIDFENMFNELYTVTGNESDVISSKQVQKDIRNWCDLNDNLQLFGLKKIGEVVTQIPMSGKGTQWWKFLQYVRTTACSYKTKFTNGKREKCFVGIVPNTSGMKGLLAAANNGQQLNNFLNKQDKQDNSAVDDILNQDYELSDDCEDFFKKE